MPSSLSEKTPGIWGDLEHLDTQTMSGGRRSNPPRHSEGSDYEKLYREDANSNKTPYSNIGSESVVRIIPVIVFT